MNWKEKLTSRKWWTAVLIAAGALYTAVTGQEANQEILGACAIVAAAIIGGSYILGESKVDAEREKSDTTVTTKNVTATTSSAKAVAAITGIEATATKEATNA